MKKAFAGKGAQQNQCSRNVLREQNNSYAQLSAKITKLEKSNKKLKCANKKCKHNCTSDSNDSDSSRSDGSGSTGKLVISCTKCNKTNKSVNTYPSPNKAIEYLEPQVNSNVNKRNNWVLWSNKDLKNLSNKRKNSIIDHMINYDTLHQQDQKSCSKNLH